ncbi:actin cytoskeleton and mitosis protein [Tilletia horrida]|uniref:Actin cytoskeleton and mitosis protein n=1 Tax=Tilletia horrida TaxID=155126 RepID=A0AAN6GCR2_9BASI|nr:actin cytoskeleton and mitosis protein [Tilletia horrida]
MDGAHKPILVMSGGGGARAGQRGGGNRASSRGAARGARGGPRGRATFRNRSATFVNGSVDSSDSGGADSLAGTAALDASPGADAEEREGDGMDDGGDWQQPLPAPTASTSFGASAFSGFGQSSAGPSAFVSPAASQQVPAQPGLSALNAAAPAFRPSARKPAAAPTSMADMRARYPTPPPEENRFMEMKNERDELRKKYIREGILPDPLKPQQLSEAVKLKGTCMRMCSEFECHEREFQKELDRWELRLDAPQAGGGAKVDQRLAVKIYRRPAAGREIPLPEEIRPPDVLKRTLDYLFNVLLPPTITSPNFALVQPFLWNRTRAVRQDFIVQGDTGALAIECHERIARLHILCLHARGGPGAEKWSEQQELEQLRKTLRSLIEFYEDRRQAAASTPGMSLVAPNEAEFRAYNLLLHLRDPETLREVELLPTSIFVSDQVQVALRLRTCAQRSNNVERRGQPINEEATLNFFTSFFREVERLPKGSGYLLACLAENVFTDVRRGAIKAMCHAYTDRLPPSYDFVRKCLGLGPEFGDTDAVELLATMGIEVGDDASGVRRAKANRGVAVLEDKPLPFAPEFSRMIEAKRADFTNAEIVDGIAANAAPLIEVSIPPFIGWNPHIANDAPAAPRPARTRSVSIVAPPPIRPLAQPQAASAFVAPTPVPQLAAPSAAAFRPTFQQPTPKTAAELAAPKSFASAFQAPQASSALQPKQPAASPFSAPLAQAPSTAAPQAVKSDGSQLSFGIKQTAPTAFTQPPAFGAPTAAQPTAIAAAPNRTSSKAAAFQAPIFVVGSSTAPALTPLKANLQGPLPSPGIRKQISLPSPGVRRSSSEKASVIAPLVVKSPVRLRPSEETPPSAAPAPPEIKVPAGPTPEELEALAKAARQRSRSSYLDKLQGLLTERLLSELLVGPSSTADTAPTTSTVEQQPLTVIVAQEALADELGTRVIQTWAFDCWRTRLNRARRDKANARRLRDLLRLASDRSLNSSSFFFGANAQSKAQQNLPDKAERTSIVTVSKGRISMSLASVDDVGDYTMQEAASQSLLEAKQRRSQLWASGDFFRTICGHMKVVPGSKTLRQLNLDAWTSIVVLASDDAATATSEWLRQKLGLGSASRRISAQIRRDEFRLAISATDVASVRPEDVSSVGLVIFELSKHVLDLDGTGPRKRIDARDLRRLNEHLLSLPIAASKLLPGLLIINWEINATTSELVEQVRASVYADPQLAQARSLVDRTTVLMAGELNDFAAIETAFAVSVRTAVPSIDAHPLQKVLALRRSLTLRDMASSIFKPLSDMLSSLAELLRGRANLLEAGSQDHSCVNECDAASRDAFATVTALCNFGIRSLLRLSEHIVDETELWTDLELSAPPDRVSATPARSMPSPAFRLAHEQLMATTLRDNDGAAVLQCLLDQQASQGDAFPWRVYFSELLAILVNQAQETFISCRVDIDVEAEMDKVAAQLEVWAHQLLTEVHHTLASHRAVSLKRSRSMIEAVSPSASQENSPVQAKKIKTPANGSEANGHAPTFPPGATAALGRANSLSAMLARARQLVE